MQISNANKTKIQSKKHQIMHFNFFRVQVFFLLVVFISALEALSDYVTILLIRFVAALKSNVRGLK